MEVPGSWAKESTKSCDHECWSSIFWLWELSCWKEGMSLAHLKFINSSWNKVLNTLSIGNNRKSTNLGHWFLKTIPGSRGWVAANWWRCETGAVPRLLCRVGQRCSITRLHVIMNVINAVISIVSLVILQTRGGYFRLLGPQVHQSVLVRQRGLLMPILLHFKQSTLKQTRKYENWSRLITKVRQQYFLNCFFSYCHFLLNLPCCWWWEDESGWWGEWLPGQTEGGGGGGEKGGQGGLGLGQAWGEGEVGGQQVGQEGAHPRGQGGEGARSGDEGRALDQGPGGALMLHSCKGNWWETWNCWVDFIIHTWTELCHGYSFSLQKKTFFSFWY